MKNIIKLIILFFAFSINANAQTEKKKFTPEDAAKSNVFELSKAIEINAQMEQALYNLFLGKHTQLMSDEKISEADKKQISYIIDSKIRATLTGEQIAKIELVPGLYQKLIM